MSIAHRYDSAERQHYLFDLHDTVNIRPRLLYAGDLKKSKGWSENAHSHDFCEIICIADGHGIVTVDTQKYPVKKGDVIIYNAGTFHAEESSTAEPLEMKFMALDRLELPQLPKNHLLPDTADCICHTGESGEVFLSEFNKMIGEFQRAEAFYMEIAENIARTILMYLFRILYHQDEHATLLQNNKNLPLALKYIQENYKKDICLEDIAQNCYLNRYYLSHIFTRQQGVSIGKYILQLRMTEAKHLLANTNVPVAQIAEEVGFRDAGHFCRTFKRECAVTPLQYRKDPQYGVSHQNTAT